jgi:hypothetical protein
MFSLSRRAIISGVLGMVTALTTVSLAVAGPSSGDVAAADAELPPVAVEDHAYPGAAAIQAEEGILLKRGDGHIVLDDCAQTSPDQIRVLTVADPSVSRQGTYCFRVTGTSGWLTLELPRVFGLDTREHPITADLTANGETTTVTVPEDSFASVGEGTVNGARSVLVEIRVTG